MYTYYSYYPLNPLAYFFKFYFTQFLQINSNLKKQWEPISIQVNAKYVSTCMNYWVLPLAYRLLHAPQWATFFSSAIIPYIQAINLRTATLPALQSFPRRRVFMYNRCVSGAPLLRQNGLGPYKTYLWAERLYKKLAMGHETTVRVKESKIIYTVEWRQGSPLYSAQIEGKREREKKEIITTLNGSALGPFVIGLFSLIYKIVVPPSIVKKKR